MYKLLLLLCGIDFLFSNDYKTIKFDILFREERDFSCTLGVSYTYWYPFQDGLRGFIGVTSNGNGLSDEDLPSSIVYPKINGRDGFKLFGNFRVNDVWDSFIGYTWFYNKDNQYMTALPTTQTVLSGNLTSSWPLSSLVNLDLTHNNRVYRTNASLAWNNAFNRIDCTFGKMLFGDNAFNFSPFLGLVAAWDDQEYEASFTWIDGSTGSKVPSVTEWVVYQDWWGVGPSVGFAPIYNVWKSDDTDSSFYLYTRSDVVVAWSQVNLLASQYIASGKGIPIDRSNPNQLSSRYRDLVTTVSPAMDVSLGGCWKIMLYKMVGLDLTLGWDLSVWFAHAYIANPVRSSSGRGLYSMQGLTASFALRF